MCTGGKYKYGKFKQNLSTSEQGWKMQVRKNRVWNNSTVTGNTTKITANDSKVRNNRARME